MATQSKRIHGDQLFQAAQNKARYSHRDWIVWRDAEGGHADVATAENMSEMLSKVGDGHWSLLCASNGTPMKGYRWLAENMIANAKLGF